jgi:hypothetical protein
VSSTSIGSSLKDNGIPLNHRTLPILSIVSFLSRLPGG